jgi:hypothetical protein
VYVAAAEPPAVATSAAMFAPICKVEDTWFAMLSAQACADTAHPAPQLTGSDAGHVPQQTGPMPV